MTLQIKCNIKSLIPHLIQKVILFTKPALNAGLKILDIRIRLGFGIVNSINMYLRMKIPPPPTARNI